MTSTSFMIGTGFMKCMPMTRSGQVVCPAIAVMEIELVLLARMVSSPHAAARSRKIWNLRSGRSLAASTTSSTPTAASSDPAGSIRATISSAATSVSLPFLTCRARFFRIAASPFSSASADTSISRTPQPYCAKTWAMPLPMVPAPTTATRFMSRYSSTHGQQPPPPGPTPVWQAYRLLGQMSHR